MDQGRTSIDSSWGTVAERTLGRSNKKKLLIYFFYSIFLAVNRTQELR